MGSAHETNSIPLMPAIFTSYSFIKAQPVQK